MEPANKPIITVETTVDRPIDVVWTCFTKPQHIKRWNFASDTWHCPAAYCDLRAGGRLVWRMEARDGTMGFDFSGTFIEVVPNQLLTYRLDDGREVRVQFTESANGTQIKESFEAESTHSPDMQKAGWQAILDNFRKYLEAKN